MFLVLQVKSQQKSSFPLITLSLGHMQHFLASVDAAT